MDNQIKLKVTKVALHGQTIKLPIIGATKISKKGIIKVSQEVAGLLLVGSGYELAEKEKKADSSDEDEDEGNKGANEDEDSGNDSEDEDEGGEEGDDEDEDENEDSEEDEEDDTITKEDLQKMEIDDIVEILKSQEVPEEQYSKFLSKKGLLINFVLKTIKQ